MGAAVSYMTEPFSWPWDLAAEEEAGGQELLAAPTPIAISVMWGGCWGQGQGRKGGVLPAGCEQSLLIFGCCFEPFGA